MAIKVKELIKELQKLDQELNVRLQTDHSQSLMSVTWVGETYIEDDKEYISYGIHEHDVTESSVKIIEIQGF